MTAKEMREFQKEQQKLLDGKYSLEYQQALETIKQAIKNDPTITYIDIGKMSKPVATRLRVSPNYYNVDYNSDQRDGSYYRITWED